MSDDNTRYLRPKFEQLSSDDSADESQAGANNEPIPYYMNDPNRPNIRPRDIEWYRTAYERLKKDNRELTARLRAVEGHNKYLVRTCEDIKQSYANMKRRTTWRARQGEKRQETADNRRRQ